MVGREIGPKLDHHAAGWHVQVKGVLEICGAHRQSPQLFLSASAATCMRTMRSGLTTAPLRSLSPFLIASIASMPETTWPKMAYLPSRFGAGLKQMKNWL